MPIFDVAGPDGKTYQFEAPEGTSQKAIDRVARNYFRDQEIESLSKPEVTNTSTPTPKDETTLGGHIKEIGKGLGSGAVGLLQTAGTGIAALLPEETEQEVRRGIEGFTKPIQQELAPAKGYEETVSRKLSEGVGSSIPFFALAPLGPAGRALGAGLGIAAGAGEARERAEKGGASPEDKRTATLLGGATGIFDMLAPGVGHAAEGVIKRAFLSGGVEGATEAAQQISQNIIAQKLYKPGQDIFEDVGPSAGYGGGAGFLTSLLLDVALPGRTRGAKTTTAPGATPPETTQVGKQFDDEATAQAAQRPEEFYGPQKPEDFIGPIAPPRPEEFIGPSPIPNQENFIGPQPKPEFVGPEAPTPEQYTASPDFVGPQLRQGIAPRTGADVLSFQRENVTQPAMNASGQNTNAFVGPPAPAYPALSKEDLGMGAFVPSSQQFVGPLPQKLTPEQLEQEKKGLNFFQPSGYEAALRGAGNTLNFTPTPTGNISAPKAFVGPSPIPNPENFIGPSPRPIGYKTKVESYVEAQNRIALEKAKATREAREQAHAENEEQAKHADYIAKLKFENELAALQAERNQKQNKTQEDRRLEVLHPILSDPKITNIPKAFARALETAGMNPGAFSVRERNLIAKAYDVRGATIETTTKRNMEPGVEQEYAAPNELELEGKPAAEVSQPSLEGFGKQQTKKPGAKAAPEEVAIVEEPLNEPIVSAQSVTNLGFPKKAPIRAKLEGKDLTDPVQREEVRTALKEFLFSGAVGPKSNLYKNISTALKNSPFLQTQKEMTGKGFNITKALLKGKKEPKTKSEEAEPAASKTTKPAKETENDSQGATVEPTVDTGTSEQGVGVGGVGVGSTSTQSEDTGGISETTDGGLGSTGVRAESTTKTEQPKSETLETEKKPAEKPAKGKNKPTTSVAVEPEIINQEWEETTTPEDKAFVKATSAAYKNLDPEDIGKARDTDRRKIGSLLKGPTRTKGENSGQLKAAKTYFSKMSRLVDNLHNMAFDFAFGMPQFRVQDKGVSAAEAKFFSGTGAKSAEQAIAWVRANLSPEVNAKLDALIEDYKASKANHTESFIENLIGQDSTTQGYYDATVNEWVKDGGLSLEKNSVNRLSFPLHPAVRGMLMQGNLAGALNIHAGLTSGIESRISSLLATGVKDVKVEIFDNLTDENGKSVAGYYDPATNTVRLDSVSGMNSHAVLHEVTHSALAKVLSNPAHPVTKQLTALYEQTKPFLSSAYGSQSLQEFVAEAWGNPEFRDNLAAINPDGTKITSWQRFKNIVGNWLRRIVGLENKTIESAFDRADRLMSAIIDPNNSGLDVTDIFAADNKGDGAHIVDNMGKLYLKTDGFTETTADRAIDAVATLPSTGKKVVLASMPTNGLIAMAKKVMGGFNIGRFNELINQHSGAMNRRKQALDVEVRALRDWESKAKKADVKRLNDVVYQSTIHEVDPEKDYNHYLIRAAEAQTAADALNAKAKTLQGKEKSVALADAKAAQKRADRYRESTKKYADITAAWKQLGADGQAQYRRMRDTYKKLNDEVGIQLGVRVGEELGESDSAKAMNKALKRLFERKGFIDPYFPLTREGDFKLSYNMKTEDGTSTEPYVEQFKTKTARERRIKELTEQGAADIERFSSMRELNYRSAPSASFISDVVDTLKVGGASEQTIDNIMRVYLQTLPETSLAQAFQHRENRLGFDQDAVGAFKKKTLSIASQLTNMEYGAKMNLYKKEMLQHFKGMRGDAAEKALPFVNEFSKRMDIAFNQHVSKWAQATTGVGFLYTLGGNISSALVNVAQVPLVVTPYLGGEYGYSNTTTALGHAARMYMSTGVSRKAKGFLEDTETTVNAMPSLGNIDFANPKLSPAMKQLETAVEIWADNGQLNRSIAYDILNADKEDSLLTKTNRTLGWTFHQGERMNREVTLIAAYNLELKRMEKNGRAIDKAAMTEAANKAIDMTELTHGGTTSASTPRILQSDLGKVLGMYKRYGAQMYYLQFKTLFDAVKGASPEERAIALRQGVGIFASTTLISGLRNAPMIGVIAMLYNMFRDDDDDTFNESMRKYVGDFAYGGAVNHYLNIQFGTRASMTDLIYHEGLNDAEKSKGQLALEQLGGVLYGTEQRVERGLKLMMQGEITRGAEQMAPAFIGNAIKAARYATEGTQTVRGDPITGPVNDGSVFAQAIGFAPADYNRQLEINSNWTNIQKAIVTKKTELQRQYFVAMRQGDSSGARETLEKIQEFNKKHPTIAITGESLMASLKQNFKTSAMMQHGIVVNPRLRAAFMQNMAEYDSDD